MVKNPALNIGNVLVNPPIILAPMSGVTNSAFRRLIKRANPKSLGLVVTEFISVEGLTRNNKRTCEMLRFREEERPISVQIFGYNINHMTQAAVMVEQAGADIVDINCGCPVPKVVRRGGGCELMRQPEHLELLLRSVVKHVSCPVTMKMRAGWDNESLNAEEIAKIAENAGVAMICVHGRTRLQKYTGFADKSLVGRIAQSVSVPVIGSGDVVDTASADEYLAMGAAGVMVGRGVLANPWLCDDISANPTDLVKKPRQFEDIIDILTQYLELLKEDLPEKAWLGRLKQIGSPAIKGFNNVSVANSKMSGLKMKGSKIVRQALCRSQTIDEFFCILTECV